jgi:hypothetical protein
MKRLKLNSLILIVLLVATLVPTQIFHYIHVVSDLTEHYQHHQDKNWVEFISNALTNGNESDTNHPEHHHSPFHQHNIHCVSTFVSTIPEIPHFNLKEQAHFLNAEKQKFAVKELFILEVTAAIWQPPKIS